jgi:hypothetical protein
MQDQPKCLTPPALTASHPVPKHPAISLHEGWVAAQAGDPLDATQGAAWIAGWRLWHHHHPSLANHVTACVVQLRDTLQQMRG